MNLNLHYPTYFMVAYLKMMNVFLNLHYPAYLTVAYLNYQLFFLIKVMITNHGSPRSYRPYSHEWKGLFTYDIFRIFPLPVAVTLTPLISTIILFQPVPSPL